MSYKVIGDWGDTEGIPRNNVLYVAKIIIIPPTQINIKMEVT